MLAAAHYHRDRRKIMYKVLGGTQMILCVCLWKSRRNKLSFLHRMKNYCVSRMCLKRHCRSMREDRLRD